MMKLGIAKLGALAVMTVVLTATAWSQDDSRPSLKQTQPGQTAPGQTAPDNTAKDQNAPAPTPEDTDYQAVYAARTGNPADVVQLGEAFVAKYPMSVHVLEVDTLLTSAYMETNQIDKMLDAGGKALQIDPDDVDVLPVLAWAVARRANQQTPDGLQQLQKVQVWARHGIELLSAITKPEGLDDAAFTAAKNDKLSMCHDGLGVVDIKTGKFDDGITEITQAMQLGSETDPVDYLLLGVAQESTKHFDDAIASFNKCATTGPVQTQCKNGVDDAKKKAAQNVSK